MPDQPKVCGKCEHWEKAHGERGWGICYGAMPQWVADQQKVESPHIWPQTPADDCATFSARWVPCPECGGDGDVQS